MEQTNLSLHQSVKATGLRVLERVGVLERALKDACRQLDPENPRLSRLDPAITERIETGFETLAIFDRRSRRRLDGDPSVEPPGIAGEAARHLESGRSLVRTITDTTGSHPVLIAAPPIRPVPWVLVGVFRPEALWPEETLHFADSNLLCWDDDGHLIRMSAGLPDLPELHSKPDRAPSGTVQWSAGRREYTCRYWTLFMKYRFDTQWLIAEIVPKQLTFGASSEFWTTFIGVCALTFMLAAFLSVNQIRRQLVPIKTLHDATRRIADGDFQGAVRIRGGDELGELAESFNQMSGSVQELLMTKTTLIDIGIALAGERRMGRFIRTVLRGAQRVLRCDGAAVLVLDDEGSIETFVARIGDRESELGARLFEAHWDESKAAYFCMRTHRCNDVTSEPEYRPLFEKIDPAISFRTTSFLGIPLRDAEGHLGGSLFFMNGENASSSGERNTFDENAVTMAELLASHAAVALAQNRHLNKREEYESGLIRAKEAAEEADRAKSEFLANIGHELRTPMTGVIGMAEILLATKLSNKQKQFVSTILTSAESQLKVINNVLNVVGMEAGLTASQDEEFDLLSVAGGIIETMKAEAKRKNVELRCSGGPESATPLVGARMRLEQVLSNIIGNAVKFTREGTVTVRIEIRPTTGDMVLSRISVTDTGIGVPRNKQESIFNWFTQADGSSTREHGGLGLGLAIAKRLVQLMGGTIGVQSRQGQGSTFWIELPFRKAAQTSEDLAA